MTEQQDALKRVVDELEIVVGARMLMTHRNECRRMIERALASVPICTVKEHRGDWPRHDGIWGAWKEEQDRRLATERALAEARDERDENSNQVADEYAARRKAEAERDAAKSDRDSWRRVAERCEGEKQDAQAELGRVKARLETARLVLLRIRDLSHHRDEKHTTESREINRLADLCITRPDAPAIAPAASPAPTTAEERIAAKRAEIRARRAAVTLSPRTSGGRDEAPQEDRQGETEPHPRSGEHRDPGVRARTEAEIGHDRPHERLSETVPPVSKPAASPAPEEYRGPCARKNHPHTQRCISCDGSPEAERPAPEEHCHECGHIHQGTCRHGIQRGQFLRARCGCGGPHWNALRAENPCHCGKPHGECDEHCRCDPAPEQPEEQYDEIGTMTATEFQAILNAKVNWPKPEQPEEPKPAADHPWRECEHADRCEYRGWCHWWTHEQPYCPLSREAHPEEGK